MIEAATQQFSNPGAFSGRNTMSADSPFTDYTASVAMYVILIGFLVSVLLIGGILIVNLGLLSKREEDRIGGRTPSDVGILKGTVWPPAEEVKTVLPAEEEEDEVTAAEASTKEVSNEGFKEPAGPEQPGDHDVPQNSPRAA